MILAGPLLTLLSPQGAMIRDNHFVNAGPAALTAQGIYAWGHDENYPAAHDVTITANSFQGAFSLQGKAIQLYGVDGVLISQNHFEQSLYGSDVTNNTCECCRAPQKIPTLCVNVTILD